MLRLGVLTGGQVCGTMWYIGTQEEAMSKDSNIKVRLSAELRDQVEQAAMADSRSMADMIRQWVGRGLKVEDTWALDAQGERYQTGKLNHIEMLNEVAGYLNRCGLSRASFWVTWIMHEIQSGEVAQ